MEYLIERTRNWRRERPPTVMFWAGGGMGWVKEERLATHYMTAADADREARELGRTFRNFNVGIRVA